MTVIGCLTMNISEKRLVCLRRSTNELLQMCWDFNDIVRGIPDNATIWNNETLYGTYERILIPVAQFTVSVIDLHKLYVAFGFYTLSKNLIGSNGFYN